MYNQLKKSLFPLFILLAFSVFPSYSKTITAPSKPDNLIMRADGAIIHDNCLERCPSGAPEDNIVVDHGVVILSSNRKTKFADWVAYTIIPAYFTESGKHSRDWVQDPKIDVAFTFTPKDYAGMSKAPYFFDRGHQAPLGSLKNHPNADAANFLSNITTQKKDLNQGSWNRLEAKERNLSLTYKVVYTLTGPYYDENQVVEGPPIRFSYKVPSGYWKIISVKVGNQIKSAHFIFPQNVDFKDNHCNFLTTASTIEQITQLKFHVPEGPSLGKELGCETSVAMH